MDAMRTHIAILDDEALLLNSLKSLLVAQGYQVSAFQQPEELEEAIQQGSPDILMLDYYLRQYRGTDVLKKLRSQYHLKAPAIIMTGLPSRKVFEESYFTQADRFLEKPIEPESLLKVIHQLETREPMEKQEDEEAEEPILFKPLAYFNHILSQELVHPPRHLVILEAQGIHQKTQHLAEEERKKRLQSLFLSFYYHLQKILGPQTIEIAVSEYDTNFILSLLTEDLEGDQLSQAIRKAFHALEKDASSPSDENWGDFLEVRTIPFTILQGNPSRSLKKALRQAKPLSRIELSSTAFSPYLQAIFHAKTGSFIGYEFLSRPQTEYSTERFYEIIARLNLHCEVDSRNVELLHQFLHKLPTKATIFFNLIPASLHHKDFLPFFFHHLEKESSRIVVEITEKCPYLLHRKTLLQIEQLRKRGFRIALDDVGSGYNNITSIIKIKPEIIKIDRTLIDHLSEDDFRASAVRALCSLASQIGAQVCAEGVENEKDYEALKFFPVTLIQGYLFHKPQRMGEILEQDNPVGLTKNPERHLSHEDLSSRR